MPVERKEIPKNVKAPLTIRQRLKGFEVWEGFVRIKAVRDLNKRWLFVYYCPECGEQLSEGPGGGDYPNSVCHPCRTNYGTLEDDQFRI